MNVHISKSCIGSNVLSGKRILRFDDISSPKQSNIGNVIATEHSIAAVNSFNTSIHLHFPPGSVEEYTALVTTLLPLVDSGKLILSGDFSDIPVRISSMTRNIDTRLNNKSVTNNDVTSSVTEYKVPVVKHSKKENYRLMSALYQSMRSKIDLDTDNDIDIDDVIELRRRLLPLFYKEPILKQIDESILDSYDFDFVINDAECQGVYPDADFYEGCRCLVEDPKKFRMLPDNIQKQVRLAAKKYLQSLPVEKRSRPCNLVSTNCP
jgi:hypothetical protein